MKKKILVLGMVLSLGLANLAQAESSVANPKILNISPVYLVVRIGIPNLCPDKDSTDAEAFLDTYGTCTLQKQLAAETEYSGSVKIVGGKLTVAKEILIGANETLTNAQKNTGVPSDEIDYKFKTSFSKGFVLKVWPDEDFAESGADMGKLVFQENVNGVSHSSFEIPFNDLVNKNYIEDFAPANPNNADQTNWQAYGMNLAVIDMMGLPLKNRNMVFKNKLTVASKLFVLRSMAESGVKSGKVDQALFQEMNRLADNAWFNNYTDADVGYFLRRYNKLKYYYDHKKPTPALFYGGVNSLMRQVSCTTETRCSY